MKPKARNLPVAVVMYLTLTIQLSCTTSIVNMVSPLTTFNKEKQHAVIRLLWAEGVRGMEIHCGLSAENGGSVLPQ
jgi:hypothetical protein